MSGRLNAPQLQGVLNLLDKKQKDPGDSNVETQFFNEALQYLLSSTVTHWWCTESILPVARESLWLFSLPDHDPIVQYKNKLDDQLKTCTYCVQAYQTSKIFIKQRYEKAFPVQTVEEFFQVIDKFDVNRVRSTLKAHETNFSMANEVMCSILEVIYAPQLLKDPKCDETFGKAFNLIQQTGSFPTFGTETTTYIFPLTLHHHRIVRFWARKLLEKFVTADQYNLSDDGYTQIKDLILAMLRSFSVEEDDLEQVARVCPFTITRDMGEFWKAFRLASCMISPQMLSTSLSESHISMPQLIRVQLSTSAEWLGEILKTMTAMLLKMQAEFWGKIENNSSAYYDIVKQICEHAVFQTAMKIAREGNTGKILQRDGSRYPDDKLMAKIKSMLEWIYPYWSSLRHTPIEKDITRKILDTTFGYFQMDTWGVMSRAYCAELGLQIIDQCLVDNSIPVEKLNEYILKVVGFAKTDANTLPDLVQHMPTVAKNILSDLVDRDSICLNKAFNAIYQTDDLTSDIEEGVEAEEIPRKSAYGSVWTIVRPCFNEDVKKFPWLAMLLFKAYANIATDDIPGLLKDSEEKGFEMSSDCKKLLLRLADIRSVVAKTLKYMTQVNWEVRKKILLESDMTKPILHLLCSPYLEIKQDASKFIQQYPRELSDQDLYHDFFYTCQPLKVTEAFSSILREFTSLTSSSSLDVFKSVPTLQAFLSIQVDLFTSLPSGYLKTLLDMEPGNMKDEDNMLGEFWDICWRTISIILEQGLKWASEYRPSTVVNLIVPILDTSSQMMASKHLFEKAIAITTGSQEATLSYNHINTMTDSLSHWIYVTRQDMISRLIPLTNAILDTLKKAEVKISMNAYDRFMTAATGVNASKLTDKERESLFMALSAHEPTNYIFLNDDSDDEDVEWQAISNEDQMSRPSSATAVARRSSSPQPSASSTSIQKKQRQMTLDQSFSNVSLSSPSRPTSISRPSVTPKITNYFAATEAEPHEISDDDIEEEFADIDYSQMPAEWLEVKTEQTSSDSLLKDPTTKDIHFGQTEAMEIEEPPSKNRIIASITAPAPSVRKESTVKPRPNVARVFPPENKQPTFAVTSKGRKLRPPSMGFSSKLKTLREEFRAERRLIATAKSPSAAGIVRQRYGADSQENSSDSSDSSSDEGGDDSGLLGLIYDLDESPSSHYKKQDSAKAESASVKALFEDKPKRAIKLLETPITNDYIDHKLKKRARDQVRIQKIRPTIDRLYKTILSWDATETREIPPHANESMYNHVPDRFNTFEEYRATFEPLLILETWCQLLRAKEQLSQNDVLERCLVEGRCHTNDFVDVTFSLPMHLITNNLSPDDLICVANHFGPQFFSNSSSTYENEKTTWKGKAFLGKVMSINQKKNMGEVLVRCYFASDRISLLNSISPKTQWCILRFMSLTTTMREYAALEGLEYYDLGKEIIQPQLTAPPKISASTVQHYCERYNVNEPQAIAIISAIQKKMGFSLIQGPPGTGKTKTILAMIVSLLDQRNNSKTNQPFGAGKLLVCAPSNAAVDEIAKRLKEGVMTSHGIRTPNVVRIGVADSVNASVKDRILDRLIEVEMDSSSGKNGVPGGKWGAKLDTLHQDIRNIQISLDDVDREITQSGSDMVQMSILRDKRKALSQKLTKSKILLKDTYQDQKNYGKELEISKIRARQKVFANADVVCATLSGSGHEMLVNMGVSFETVIVDEAAQSIEISSLIPLKFDTQRCILVGDPNQLPPTVMSILAAKYDYQQSLFMRLEKTVDKEVNLLSIQYRMHPDISLFPSKMFYNSRLLDGPDMHKSSSAIWHSLAEFPPYRFFNILDGQEKVGRGKSIFNVAEADAAVALVDMLCTKLPTTKFASKIGVITPYKQQVGQLKSRFQKRFGNSIVDVIDFNTVDGFQGQEKEIVIFSCVRAGQGRGIGFLADIRRMNVGLTRAKCSLFVLGHARSLSNSEYWGDLVRDAQKRSLITDCEYPYFKHRINEISIPQNIFEKNAVLSKKRSIQHKKGPVRIAQPLFAPNSNSNSDSEEIQVKTGEKRAATSSVDANERATHRRRTEPDDVVMEEVVPSFIDKVRQDKEKKLVNSRSTSVAIPEPRATASVATTHTKRSMAEYRASRGLSSVTTSTNRIPLPPRQNSSSGSSLFINRKKPAVSRPKPAQSIWPEGVSAKEHAILEHSAARDRIRNYREEERRREQPASYRNPPPVRSIDNIVDDVQSKYRRDNRHHRDPYYDNQKRRQF